MEAFLASLVFVVLAEMGDKTQLLAMAFSCRYRWQTVMWGVFVATAANHLMAAALGSYLTTIVPLDWIRAAAAASFILFGLWTIRGDKLEGEDRRFAFNPFWKETVAFFIAEMGDKTQLATVALAVEYNSIFSVWYGTTIGMLISNAIGIVVAVVMLRIGGFHGPGSRRRSQGIAHNSAGGRRWAMVISFSAENRFEPTR